MAAEGSSMLRWQLVEFCGTCRQLQAAVGFLLQDKKIRAAGGCLHVTPCPQDSLRVGSYAKKQCHGVQEMKATGVRKLQSQGTEPKSLTGDFITLPFALSSELHQIIQERHALKVQCSEVLSSYRAAFNMLLESCTYKLKSNLSFCIEILSSKDPAMLKFYLLSQLSVK